MCGIVGYVSTRNELLNREKENFLHDALILDTFRGFDSTGLITLCEEFTVSAHKELLQGWDFVRTREFHEMPNGWAAIGHNRAATKGKVNRDNAHPFNHGPVTLVHNGTLTNMGSNLPNYCNKQDVDSMNLARALGHVAPEDAVEVLESIQGAYALAWTDERDRSVNIVRNGQRPLHFAHNQTKSILWFMSDGKHLEMLKKRGWCCNIDMGQVWQFNTHTHFKWKKGTLKPEVAKYTPKALVRPQYQQYPSYSGPLPLSGSSAKRTKPVKSGLKVPLSHRISINGQMAAIPKALVEDLDLAMDLTPDKTLTFRPKYYFPYPKRPEQDGYGYVTGMAYIPAWEMDWECVVHNVNEKHAEKIALETWDVIPYAVTEQMPGPSEDCYGVQCRVKRFNVPLEEPEETHEEEEEVPFSLIGPHGRLYSSADWLRLTRNGCSECSCDLEPSDHDTIWWLGEMEREPICEDCADELADTESRMKEVMLH
jgi:hypothetical protein